MLQILTLCVLVIREVSQLRARRASFGIIGYQMLNWE
jgi:hypothetical protein